MAAYANGELPAEALAIVETGTWLGKTVAIALAVNTAAAYKQMKAACAAEGKRLEIALPDGGYRSLATQAEMRADFYAHNYTRHNLDPGSTVAPAAAGYSNHGFGLCADIWGTGYAWAVANGGRFGFTRPFPVDDPHHFEHSGVAPSTSGTSPLTQKRKDQDMPAVIKRTTGTPEWSLIWPPLRGPSELERGYVVTVDAERAKWWARFYELGQGSEDLFERDEYVKAQEIARNDHAAWLAGVAAAQGAVRLTEDQVTAIATGVLNEVLTRLKG